jgi:hypothetical protein
LNDTNGNEKVPYPWYPGEWIIVALKVDGCNFDHTFILRPPSDEQVAHMDKETQEVLLANGGVVGYPEPISLNAGRCSVTSGQFGFLSLDSTLKVLLFSLESIR